MTMTNAYEQPH